MFQPDCNRPPRPIRDGLGGFVENYVPDEHDTAFVNCLRFLLMVARKIRIDRSNGMLRRMAGHILGHGVQYEQEKFESFVRVNQMQRTIDMFHAAFRDEAAQNEKVLELVAARDPDAVRLVHARMVANLLGEGPIAEFNCVPETYRMDLVPLIRAERKFYELQFCGAAVALLRQEMPCKKTAEELVKVLLSSPKDVEMSLINMVACLNNCEGSDPSVAAGNTGLAAALLGMDEASAAAMGNRLPQVVMVSGASTAIRKRMQVAGDLGLSILSRARDGNNPHRDGIMKNLINILANVFANGKVPYTPLNVVEFNVYPGLRDILVVLKAPMELHLKVHGHVYESLLSSFVMDVD